MATEEMNDERTIGPSWLGWLLLGLVVVILLIGGFTVFGDRLTTSSDNELKRVLGETDQLIGQQVDVSGTVGEILGAQAFTLESPELFDGGDLLVVSRQSLQPIGGTEEDIPFDEGDRVFVRGVVKNFNLREVESDLNIDLVDEDFNDFNGKPVIIADTVETNL